MSNWHIIEATNFHDSSSYCALMELVFIVFTCPFKHIDKSLMNKAKTFLDSYEEEDNDV
jgi:hypothetical protein